MSSRPLLSWILLAVWSAWLHGLQGLWASGSPWAADLGVVLLVVLAGRMQTADLPGMALAVALGRLAVSVDPPAAVLAGCFGWVVVARGARTVVEIHGLLPRAFLAGAGALVLAAWLGLVHELRLGGTGAPASVLATASAAWPAALSTALLALVLGPALALLPGLSPLQKKRKWAVAVSGH